MKDRVDYGVEAWGLPRGGYGGPFFDSSLLFALGSRKEFLAPPLILFLTIGRGVNIEIGRSLPSARLDATLDPNPSISKQG